jgi:hypothetical protein
MVRDRSGNVSARLVGMSVEVLAGIRYLLGRSRVWAASRYTSGDLSSSVPVRAVDFAMARAAISTRALRRQALRRSRALAPRPTTSRPSSSLFQ